MAAGDRDAFGALYERYQRPVFGYIVKLVRDGGRAEELTQEVLLEVWRRAGTWEARGAVSTWIFGIAHHKALNDLRRRRETALDEEEAERVADDTMGPVERVESKDAAQRLKRLLDRLTPEHRAVLELTYYQGFSIQQIAEALGCPESTVKTRAFYARQRLKEMMERP